jgi:ATP-binding cassette subfamily F protein 3
MAIITLSGVRKSFGAFQVLDDVSFTVGAGEKIALVGPNGSGKSTILHLILGYDEPDSGALSIIPGTSIGFMQQDSQISGDHSLIEEVATSATEILRLERELRRLEIAMTDPNAEMEVLVEEYGEIQHEFDRLGGYAFEAEIKSTLSGLGLGPEHWEKPVGVLSGGQKTRAALAKLLLQKADVLLLDEPTNHLDIEASEWLEEFLQDFSGAVVVVSHDRYFLDRVATKVVDLHERCTHSYPGNYTAFVRQKDDLLRQQAKQYDRQQEEIKKLEDFIHRYHAGQRAKEAKSRQKQIGRIDRIRRPKTNADQIKLKLAPASRSGNIVMDIQGLYKSFGDKPLFRPLDLLIESGDRIGLIGPNGAGKTTLLRMILEDLEPTGGAIHMGYGVEIGYFDQNLSQLDTDNTVIEELLDFADMTPGEARNMLGRFLFIGDDVFKSVSALSGGERNRLVLAKLMIQRPNLLILDEPTNHLDIDSRQALDAALRTFDGTIILTTHDRYLLNSVVNRIVHISAGEAKVYEGDYEFFAEKYRATKPRPTKRKVKPAPKKADSSQPKGPSLKEIEKLIEESETRLAEVSALLNDADVYADAERSSALLTEYNTLNEQIPLLYEQWEEIGG